MGTRRAQTYLATGGVMVLELGLGLGLGFILGNGYRSMMARRLNTAERSNIRYAIYDELKEGGEPDDEIVLKVSDLRAIDSLVKEIEANLVLANKELLEAHVRIAELEHESVNFEEVLQVILKPVPEDIKVLPTPAAEPVVKSKPARKRSTPKVVKAPVKGRKR